MRSINTSAGTRVIVHPPSVPRRGRLSRASSEFARKSAKCDAPSLRRRIVGRFEIIHIHDAIVKGETRLVDFAANELNELLLHAPRIIKLRWNRSIRDSPWYTA